MRIVFHNLPEISVAEAQLKQSLFALAHEHNAKIEQLEYYFVSVQQLLMLNKKHLDHNTDTDIITFDYGQPAVIVAEVYIAHQTVTNNALEFGQTTENETLRVIAHGLLHCLGHGDKTANEQKKMRKLENTFLNKFHVKHSTHV